MTRDSTNGAGDKMWDSDKTFARVAQALDDGELWKAKEILQGTLRHQGYVPELYERYGRVLLRMGDLIEAGRYLFLSGARQPDYEKAISLYLARHTRRKGLWLYNSFPKRAKLKQLDDYPAALAEELREFDVPEHLPGPRLPGNRTEGTDLGGWGCLLVALVIAFVLVGAGTVLKWLFSWILG